tara:strand:+ start:1244 stop:1474 length:231 start_codon:yes stop_codon:yes gene_type:complete
MAKPKKKQQKDYDGKYDDIMEGEYLVMMRRSIEDFDAGKITKKQYDEDVKSFLNEFPKSAIKLLKQDIAADAAKKK